jgi:hypothetical protein
MQRCHSISNEKSVSILEKITNNIISIPKSVWCEGKTPDDITGLLPLNGNGIYDYSWQEKPSSGTWSDRSDTSIGLNTPLITSTIDYRRIVRSGLNGTCKDTSNLVSLTMQDSILNNDINNNQVVFICYDEDSVIQATVPGILTGGDESNYSYLWYQGLTAQGPFEEASEIPNTGSSYLSEPVQSARYYRRRVTSGDCESTSDPVLAGPLDLPELVALSSATEEICINKLSPVLNITIQSGSLPYTVSFSDGQGFIDTRTFTSAADQIQPVVNEPPLPPGYTDYQYKVISIMDSEHCFAKPAQLVPFSADLRVYSKPAPTAISNQFVESCSGELQMSVNPGIGQSAWYLSNNYGIQASSTNTPVIDLMAAYSRDDSASVSLAYVETIANCASDTLFMSAVLYNKPDSIENIYKIVNDSAVLVGDPVIIFISDNQVFGGDTIKSGVPFWQILSGAGELSDNGLYSTMITGLDQDNPTRMEYSISNGICPVSKHEFTIERKELLVYDGFSPNGDGINDELWAVGLADEEVDFKFLIFSSSGSFVSEITKKDVKEVDLPNNQVVLWDGSTTLGGKGNFIPDGTYYYVLLVTYRNESFNKRGYVLVKR